MAYRLPGGRVTLSVDGYAGLQVEVEPIGAWPIYQAAVGLAAAYFAASAPAAEFGALSKLYGFFCIEAQPTWEIVDHRGVIEPTPTGMLRLPIALTMGIVTSWAEEFTKAPPSTAVDEVYPPGPVRDELNRRLKAVA